MSLYKNNINIEETECIGFKAYRFTNNEIELTVVPDIGGRIMNYGYLGRNILFQNQSLYKIKPSISAKNYEELKMQRKKMGYFLYGGEKTWVAPQGEWEGPPYIDLDSGSYEMNIYEGEKNLVIELISSICRETQLRIIRLIEFPYEGTEVTIKQRLENKGQVSVYKGLWQVTMVKRPAKVIFPNGSKSNFQNNVKSFDEINDKSHIYSIIDGKVIVNCETNEGYKIGTSINRGYVNTVLTENINKIQTIFREEFPINDGPYGHGCVIEVYNSSEYDYFEVEVHSPMQIILPNDYIENTIKWLLQKRLECNKGKNYIVTKKKIY